MNDPRVGQTVIAFAETLGSFAGRLKQIWGQTEPNTQSQPASGINDAPPFDAGQGTHITTQKCVVLQQPSMIPGSAVPFIESHSTMHSSEPPRHATSTVQPPRGLPHIHSPEPQSSHMESIQGAQESHNGLEKTNFLPATLSELHSVAPGEDEIPLMEHRQSAHQSRNVLETTDIPPSTLSEPHPVTLNNEEVPVELVAPQTMATSSSLGPCESMGELSQPDTICLPCLQLWKKSLGAKRDLPDCKYDIGRQTCALCVDKKKSRKCVKVGTMLLITNHQANNLTVIKGPDRNIEMLEIGIRPCPWEW